MPATDRGSGRRGGRSRLVAAALLAAGCSEASPSPEPAPTEDALHDELVASDFEGEDALGGLGYVDFGEVADEPRRPRASAASYSSISARSSNRLRRVPPADEMPSAGVMEPSVSTSRTSLSKSVR